MPAVLRSFLRFLKPVTHSLHGRRIPLLPSPLAVDEVRELKMLRRQVLLGMQRFATQSGSESERAMGSQCKLES